MTNAGNDVASGLPERADFWHGQRAQERETVRSPGTGNRPPAPFRPAEQAHIIQLLIKRADIAEGALDNRFRTDGFAGLVREFGVDARAAG